MDVDQTPLAPSEAQTEYKVLDFCIETKLDYPAKETTST